MKSSCAAPDHTNRSGRQPCLMQHSRVVSSCVYFPKCFCRPVSQDGGRGRPGTGRGRLDVPSGELHKSGWERPRAGGPRSQSHTQHARGRRGHGVPEVSAPRRTHTYMAANSKEPFGNGKRQGCLVESVPTAPAPEYFNSAAITRRRFKEQRVASGTLPAHQRPVRHSHAHRRHRSSECDAQIGRLLLVNDINNLRGHFVQKDDGRISSHHSLSSRSVLCTKYEIHIGKKDKQMYLYC